jgi:hypothetical protein
MQVRFFAWLATYNPEIYKVAWHTPNQGRSAQEGAKLKLMGVKAGVPDIFVAVPFNSLLGKDENYSLAIGSYPGLFLELKSDKGSLSDSQKLMLDNLGRRGFMCCTANTLEKAKQIIRNCYGGME